MMKRIQILLDDEAQELLSQLQAATRSESEAAVLRDAVAVYDWFRRQLCEGHRLARIEHGTGKIHELLLPSLPPLRPPERPARGGATAIADEQLAQLRELASKATPGPWVADPDIAGGEYTWTVHADRIARGTAPWEGPEVCHCGQAEHDARYIAACDPAAILALLDERDGLLSALAKAEGRSRSGTAEEREARHD